MIEYPSRIARLLAEHQLRTSAEIAELVARVQFCVDFMDDAGLLDSDHTFTFPDGDTWVTTDQQTVDQDPESADL